MRVRQATGFWGVAFAFGVTMAGTTLPTPLYPLLQQKFGFDELASTLLYAVYAAGVIAALLVFGRASDVLGRRRVLLAGSACAVLSAVAFLSDTGLAGLLAGRVLSGLSAGLVTGTATAALGELHPRGDQAHAGLVATVANMFGLGCGPLISGVLATVGPAPLQLSFLVHLALVVPAGIAVWRAGLDGAVPRGGGQRIGLDAGARDRATGAARREVSPAATALRRAGAETAAPSAAPSALQPAATASRPTTAETAAPTTLQPAATTSHPAAAETTTPPATPPTNAPPAGAAGAKPRFRVVRPVLPVEVRPVFLPAAAAMFAAFAVFGLVAAVGPSMLVRVLDVRSPAVPGVVVFAMFAASAAGQVASRHLRAVHALPIGCAVVLAGVGGLATAIGAQSAAVLAAATVVIGAGQGVAFRGAVALVGARAPDDERAGTMSSFFLVVYVGISVPVVLAGAASARWGLRTSGLVFAGVVAVLLVAALFATGFRTPLNAKRIR